MPSMLLEQPVSAPRKRLELEGEGHLHFIELALTPSQIRRFFAAIEKPAGDEGCWFWRGATNVDGYGIASNGGEGAHAVAYRLMVGAIPEGLELDHLCRQRACVNPHHLEPVTHAENQRRARDKNVRRPFRRYCRRGHALTPENVRLWSNGTRPVEQCYQCYLARTERRKAAKHAR